MNIFIKNSLNLSVPMNLSSYKETKPHFFKRIIWWFVNRTIFYFLMGQPFMRIRNVILRLFGAQIDKDACVYNSCMIFAPWNLKIGRACIGPHTTLYNKDVIVIGNDCVISQGTFLCTASHNIGSTMLPLVTAPIFINDKVWVAAEAVIGMGVTIGEGAVVGARGCVFKDVEPWTVVGGNPVKLIKRRINY